MLKVHYRNLDRALRDLEKFKRTAVPYAARDGLNGAAFEARRVWGDTINRTFTTRNQYTARTSIRVDKAKGRRVDSMQAVVGSLAEYMGQQEQGFTTSGPIPGPGAAGQRAGGIRTKPVRVPVGAIDATRGRAPTRRQRTAIALAIARRRGKKHVLLERPQGGKALFRLQGGKRRINLKLMWVVDRGGSKVKPHPTLGPTMRVMADRVPEHMQRAVVKQLKFHRIWNY